jgi:hypothetical protein
LVIVSSVGRKYATNCSPLSSITPLENRANNEYKFTARYHRKKDIRNFLV